MILTNMNLGPVLPELFLLVAGLAILMLDLVLEENQRGLLHWFSVATLAGCVRL